MCIMKNWKCILGIHNYKYFTTQHARNVVDGFSMSPLTRDIKKCNKCGKVRVYGYDISTDAHNDKTLNWQPKIKL